MGHKNAIISLVKEALDAKKKYAELQSAVFDEINKNYKVGDLEIIPTDIPSNDPEKRIGIKVEKKGKNPQDCSFVLVKT